MNVSKLALIFSSACLAILSLTSCGSPGADVKLAPGAALGSYDIVFINSEDAWMANHGVIEVLQQEIQRRRYAVQIGPPTPELVSRSMILQLDYVGTSKTPHKGGTEKLKYLRFRLLDGPSKSVLANVSYDEDTLDRIGQKSLVREVADQLFGSEE